MNPPCASRSSHDHPRFGTPQQFACERANRLFCWGWFKQNWGSVLWPALRQHIVLVLIAVAIGFAIAMALALFAYRYRGVEQPVISLRRSSTRSRRWRCSSCSWGCRARAEPHDGRGRARLLHAADPVPQHPHRAAQRARRGARRRAGMGMSRPQMLWRVELPLALPAIIAGLRIATVSDDRAGDDRGGGRQSGPRRADPRRDQRRRRSRPS